MTKFTHQAPVVRVLKEKHPEADKLSLVYLFDRSVQLVVNSDSWQDGELAIYLQPQSLVDCWKEPFTFLNKGDGEQWVRVKAMKLRGYVSNGCLVKIPSDLSVSEGDDVAATLDIRHWEPELDSLTTGGQTVKGEHLSDLTTLISAFSRSPVRFFLNPHGHHLIQIELIKFKYVLNI